MAGIASMSVEKKLSLLTQHCERTVPIISRADVVNSTTDKFYLDKRVIDLSHDQYEFADGKTQQRHDKLALGRRGKLADQLDSNCTFVQDTSWPARAGAEERQPWKIKGYAMGCPQAKQNTAERLFTDTPPKARPLRTEHLAQQDRGARDYNIINASPLGNAGKTIMA